MPAEAWIIDGYVDEPACLGVPPYISPYIRTIAGVLKELGYDARYCTIDQVRADPYLFPLISKATVMVMIAGVTVPGKYLGGTPATLTEIQQIGLQIHGPEKYIGGPIAFGYSPGGGEKAIKQAISGFDHLLTGSSAEALYSHLTGGKPEGKYKLYSLRQVEHSWERYNQKTPFVPPCYVRARDRERLCTPGDREVVHSAQSRSMAHRCTDLHGGSSMK